ncbi:unnamed protein product, partial [Discosporangium mesarthrocarpum]
LTSQVLVDRLASRHLHYLAVKVCELLFLKHDRVAVHWACRRIATAASGAGGGDEGGEGGGGRVSDEELREAVVEKLRPCGQISYVEVAKAAEASGRRRLATMLLDYEPLATDQARA